MEIDTRLTQILGKLLRYSICLKLYKNILMKKNYYFGRDRCNVILMSWAHTISLSKIPIFFISISIKLYFKISLLEPAFFGY